MEMPETRIEGFVAVFITVERLGRTNVEYVLQAHTQWGTTQVAGNPSESALLHRDSLDMGFLVRYALGPGERSRALHNLSMGF
jgi:hypothetical protein